MNRTTDEVKTIVVLIEFETGEAHQVIASPAMKQMALRMLSQSTDGLRVSKELNRVEFIEKTLPVMIASYCQVGTLVSLKTSFLGQPIGTRCIVYHVDESGSAAIISDEGVEFGYFTEPEILEHLEFLNHKNLNYTFISVMRLMEDFRQGRFEQCFK